ncbi:hypothetical protein SEVIR_2G119600v4 [Setaria viridis]|uniref:ATG8-interacting protein 1 n=2 Tax=Setaria TaxID=4554 RepID=K3ZWA7_SETIT|nr:ATG8-interacting protein 1 [Setaria italica]XP_034583427.1 ATG8-interacting protein 1-like [Setaria viridis]XP_034583428.1 ATG8-interacting protein 1-like [Setaria viridis]RCV10450.1 hypothetical protein SETIT_2G113600v2 [Setaria italica]RCV10451.1 hypothetical protein SETIT_2G113600v2 [Setaria italica]TKW31644.1 hypothetical protein SEVIR_2G119600v2 [Setaria viridis]TKW31645.1 hypothetical protein SEVIR_2G119600v2 [Setaria viridis]
MADDNMVTGVSPVADEWDMPPLTSSVYASPLFRKGLDPINLPGYGDVKNSQEGTHTGLVMSDGFVFPPSEHENLPIDPEHEILPIEPEHDESNTNSDGKEGSCAGSNDDEWCHVSPEEVDGMSNENLSINSDLPTDNESPLPDSNPTDHMNCKADLPCEGWWKRKSTYLFHHIKGVTTVCSVVAAGAVVGFVVMSQRWQQDHLHLHQFQFSVNGESMSRVIGAFSRLKDGLPGSEQLRSLLPTRVLPQQPLSA